MTAPLACPLPVDDDTAHRYVAGTLPSAEVDRFEIHLLECLACQDAVRSGAAVRAALGRLPEARRSSPLRWVLPLAAAAALATLWVMASRAGPLERLGRIAAAPSFDGLPVRSGPDSAARLADLGMAAYQAGRYAEAAGTLARATAAEPSAGLSFYLGVSLLMAGNPAAAVGPLADAARDPLAVYSAEGRYYLAKAWLQQGRADSALAALVAAPGEGLAAARRAGALADSIREVIR